MHSRAKSSACKLQADESPALHRYHRHPSGTPLARQQGLGLTGIDVVFRAGSRSLTRHPVLLLHLSCGF